MKVHKAASSTVQNIMLRFAMARNLSVLLPIKGVILNQETKEIDRRDIAPHPEGKDKFDILCNHVVYDWNEIARFIPESALRITILREPMDQAISALVYYSTVFKTNQLKSAIKKYPRDPINGFLRHPKDFYEPDKKWGPMKSFVNNRMSLDLGFDRYNLEFSKSNKAKIESFLRRIEREFDFVLFTEYFDESMILLRRHLRWSMKDIIYIRVNAAIQKPAWSPFSHKPNITPEVTKIFRQWNRIDYELYEHFLPKFQEKLKTEINFESEVKAFKKLQKAVVNFCSNDISLTYLHIEQSTWTKSFTVTKSECALMSSEETSLVRLARERQLIRFEEYVEKLYS